MSTDEEVEVRKQKQELQPIADSKSKTEEPFAPSDFKFEIHNLSFNSEIFNRRR